MSADREPEDDEQRRRLLAGLAASIREKGLAQTQLADIVRHAKASRRTFYKHFPDKDACFVELAHQLGELGRASVAKAIDPDAPWEQQVDAAIDAYLALLASDPAMAVTFSSPSLGDSIVRAQREGMERYAALVVDLSVTASARGADVADISLERAYMLVAGLHQTVTRTLQRGEDPRALAPELKAVFKAAAVARVPVAP